MSATTVPNNIEWKVVDLPSHEHEKERIRAKQDRALNAWEGAKRKVSEINAKLEANAINATQPMSALRISLRAAEAECTRLRVQFKNALHDPRGPPVVDDAVARRRHCGMNRGRTRRATRLIMTCDSSPPPRFVFFCARRPPPHPQTRCPWPRPPKR